MRFEPSDPTLPLRLSIAIAAAGLTVELLEFLVRPPFLSEHGPVPWSIVQLQHRWTASGSVNRALSRLYANSSRVFLVAAALLSATVGASALLAPAFRYVQVGCIGVALTLGLLALRSFYGLDGAYHMLLVIFVTVAVTAPLPGAVGARMAAYVIGANAALAYLISGVSKLLSPVWRRGVALPGILGTRSYGHALLYRVLHRRPLLAVVLCWTVIAFEIGFPVAILAGRGVLLAFLVAGVVFHLAVAAAMGLNGFLFAFLATFPCVAYLSSLVR
jgi:hypothetical protein